MSRKPPLRARALILLSILVGVVSGLGAFFFYTLLELSTKVFLTGMGGFEPYPASGDVEVLPWSFDSTNIPLFLIPAIGGLLSGILVYRFAPEAEGHGTDAVIRSFHRLKGDIRGRVPIIKTIASAITIGSGGSAGREGPIAQIGAGFGSAIGKILKLSDRDRRVLLICGVAGGIGSIFQSPLGGALFGIEVLYKRDYEVEALIPAFTSSIVAYTVYDVILGYTNHIPFGTLRIFSVPDLRIHSPLEMFLYLFLGVIAGVTGLLYIRSFYTIHDLFKKLKITPYLKPAIGGLITGIIGMLIPGVMGMGYGYVQLAIDGRLALSFIFAFIFAKIIATSFTIGSGGSGGVFAPSVVIGGMLGALLGHFFNSIIPDIVVTPESYVLVGMAAFVSAAAKTPMAAIIMVMEMSGGYNLLPALMVSSIVAYKITGNNSIYSEQVSTRVDSPAHRAEMLIDVLENVKVRDAMVPADKVISVKPGMSVLELLELIESTGHLGYPVIKNGHLIGIVTFEDVERVPVEKRNDTKVEDIMTRELIVTYPDENLEEALKKLTSKNIGRLPVVSRDNSSLKGLITRSDIMKAHAREILKIGK